MSVKKNQFQKASIIIGLYIMTAVMLEYLFRHTDILPKWMNPYHWNETAYYIYSIGICYFFVGIFVSPTLMTFVLVILYSIAYPFWDIKENIKEKFPVVYALMIIAFLIFYWTQIENIHIYAFINRNIFL